MSTRGNVTQIAPGNFPEPEQRALNDAFQQVNAIYPTLLNDQTVVSLAATATLSDVIAKVNEVITVLRAFGLR